MSNMYPSIGDENTIMDDVRYVRYRKYYVNQWMLLRNAVTHRTIQMQLQSTSFYHKRISVVVDERLMDT